MSSLLHTPPGGRLSPDGRRRRLVVTAAAALLLLWGTFWGSDDSFPFGPFRMFAHANKPDGVVYKARVEAVDADGRRFRLRPGVTGLRGAEIEGQLLRLQEDPSPLAELAETYNRRHDDAAPVTQIDIIRRRIDLEDSRPAGAVSDRVMVTWDASEARR